MKDGDKKENNYVTVVKVYKPLWNAITFSLKKFLNVKLDEGVIKIVANFFGVVIAICHLLAFPHFLDA